MEGRQTQIFAMLVEEEAYGGPQTAFSNEVSKNSRQRMSSKDSFKGRTTYSQLNASRQFESKGRDEITAVAAVAVVAAAAAVAVAVLAVSQRSVYRRWE